MSEYLQCWYLFHSTPPIEVGFSPLLLLRSPLGDLREVKLTDIAGFKSPLVTHSFTLLIDWFRRYSLPLPANVVEIELAKKLIVGRPKSDFKKGSLPWDMSEIIAPYLPEEYNQPKMRQALSTHLTRPSTEAFSNLKWMEIAAGLLPQIWEDLKKNLIRIGEAERFFSIEVPVYNVMLISQLEGVRVAPDKRDALLCQVEMDYLSSHHSLAITQRIDVPRALNDVLYLAEHLGIGSIEKSEFYSPQEIISQFKTSDQICSLLHTILSARRNKGILLKTFSIDSEFCYPVFDTLGTVTGRILAVDPQLQHLKKEYRSLLVPRDAKSLLYFDYSQFEPNIMGSLSCDSTLLKLCCKGDLYSELALRIFGEIGERDDAKILFLAYSYGMGKTGLAKLTSKMVASIDTVSQILEDNFFNAFA
ncbi:MAG: DNA polymerase, partial [Desulfobaccales bacterium]